MTLKHGHPTDEWMNSVGFPKGRYLKENTWDKLDPYSEEARRLGNRLKRDNLPIQNMTCLRFAAEEILKRLEKQVKDKEMAMRAGLIDGEKMWKRIKLAGGTDKIVPKPALTKDLCWHVLNFLKLTQKKSTSKKIMVTLIDKHLLSVQLQAATPSATTPPVPAAVSTVTDTGTTPTPSTGTVPTTVGIHTAPTLMMDPLMAASGFNSIPFFYPAAPLYPLGLNPLMMPPVFTTTPAPAVNHTVIPVPATDQTPAPAPTPEQTPAPALAPEQTPAPAPATDQTPAPAPATEQTPVPAPATEQTPAPAPATDQTSAPAPATDHMTSPASTTDHTATSATRSRSARHPRRTAAIAASPRCTSPIATRRSKRRRGRTRRTPPKRSGSRRTPLKMKSSNSSSRSTNIPF